MIELLRPISRLPLVTLLIALALVASACGSSADDEDVSAEATAAEPTEATPAEGGEDAGEGGEEAGDGGEEAAGGSDAGVVTEARLGDRVLVSDLAATTGRFEGRIAIAGADIPDGIEIVITGAFDSANRASEVSIDLGAAAMAAAEQEGADLGPMASMLEEPMVVRTIDSTAYLSWGLFSLFTGGQGTWIEAEASEAGDITSSFGGTSSGSPIDLLATLEDADAEITEIGSEEVRGVDTTHIRAVIDIAALGESLSDDERTKLERDLGDVSIEEFPIEFWLDDDGLIRRYRMDLGHAADADDEIDQAELVFEFFDYGAEITIERPPEDEIVSSDAFDLGAFDFGN